MEINVVVVEDDGNEGKERRKAMSLPDLTKKSITVVDSIDSVSVVVGKREKAGAGGGICGKGTVGGGEEGRNQQQAAISICAPLE